MKIGTFENLTASDSAQVENPVEVQPYEELPQMDDLINVSADEAISILDNDDDLLNRMSAQVELLGETMRTLEESDGITAAEARAYALQMSNTDEHLPASAIMTRESLMSQLSDDRKKNLELTKESMGATIAVITATLAVIGAILGALYYFLKNNDLGGKQTSHINNVFNRSEKIQPNKKGIAGGSIGNLTAMPKNRREDIKSTVRTELKSKGVTDKTADQVADKITDKIIRIKGIYDGFGFFSASHIAPSDFKHALSAYNSSAAMAGMSNQLSDKLDAMAKELSALVSRGDIPDDQVERIKNQLDHGITSTLNSIQSLGRELRHNDARLALGVVDRGRTYYSFPLFRNSSGPVISIDANNVARSETISPNGSPAVTSDIDAMAFISLKTSFRELPAITKKAEESAERRAEVGKHVLELSKKLKASSTGDNQRVGVTGVIGSLNSARSLITALDSAWLKMCKCANQLTDIAATTFEVTLAAQEAERAKQAAKP